VRATLLEPEARAGGGAAGAVTIDSSKRQLQLGNGAKVETDAMQACLDTYVAGKTAAKFECNEELLNEAYERCGEITAEYAKTFYFATNLFSEEKRRAIWAIYVWCRRTDELVDGPNASHITPEALDRWEERLDAIYAGRPYDLLDAALCHTVSNFPIDVQPFRDMVDGMRTDLVKTRYGSYEELREYCYRVAGTVGLMVFPIMGMDPRYVGSLEPVYRAALALGLANQLTNVLRDVGEDVRTRNRIYVPTEELERFGISEADVVSGAMVGADGAVDQRWKDFMRFQIDRAYDVFAEAEAGVNALSENARWPVWCALILYRQILDRIADNSYNNFDMRAYVPKERKFLTLPQAWAKAATATVPTFE